MRGAGGAGGVRISGVSSARAERGVVLKMSAERQHNTGTIVFMGVS